VFGFLGANGAGKTTTLKMLAGLTNPDSGSIKLQGTNVSFGNMKGREKIGYLPDVPECYGYMRPVEFLGFCADLYGFDAKTRKMKSLELLDLVGLNNVNKRIASFSRGMKQRLGIAQALINEPDIVLMDEPASALDPTGRFEVMEILTRLKGKTTIFFSTHIISDIERVCDSIAIIDKGRILQQGSVSDLKMQFDNKCVSVAFPEFISKDEIYSFNDEIKKSVWYQNADFKGDRSLLIKVADRPSAQRDIIRIAASRNLAFEQFNSLAISLEDIFLEVTKA
jgi:ABC-2 type transport system ATP-binding protein